MIVFKFRLFIANSHLFFMRLLIVLCLQGFMLNLGLVYWVHLRYHVSMDDVSNLSFAMSHGLERFFNFLISGFLVFRTLTFVLAFFRGRFLAFLCFTLLSFMLNIFW